MEYEWHGSVSDDETPTPSLSGEFHVLDSSLVDGPSAFMQICPYFMHGLRQCAIRIELPYMTLFSLSLSLSLSTMISGGTAISKQGIVITA